MDIWHFLRVIRRERWTLLVCFVVSLVAVALFSHVTGQRAPNAYLSSTKILLTPENGAMQGNAQSPSGFRMWFADEVVLRELIGSQKLLSTVLQHQKSSMDWQTLRQAITVEPLSRDGNGVNLFRLSVTAGTSANSRDLVRTLSEQFVTYVQELSAKEFSNNRAFIEEMLAKADYERSKKEQELVRVRQAYMGRESESSLAEKKRDLKERQADAQREVHALEVQVTALQAYREAVRTGRPATIPWSVLEKTESSLGSLEQALSEQRLTLVKLEQTWTPGSPKVASARDAVQRVAALYQKEANSYTESLLEDKCIALIQKRSLFNSLTKDLNELIKSEMSPDERMKLTKLERELSIWEENYLRLQQQHYQARVAEQGSRRQGAVTILEQPVLGTMVVAKGRSMGGSRLKRLLVAAPLCLFAALVLALFKDYLGSSMKLRPRVEETLDLPVLAVIPRVSEELSTEWETFKRPRPSMDPLVLTGMGGRRHTNGNGNTKN